LLKNYIKIAFKVFSRRKFFTLVSLFGISFTLTVLMITAAALDSMFAPSVPELKQDRTLIVPWAMMWGKEGMTVGGPGYKFLAAYVKPLPNIECASASTMNEAVSSFKDGYEVKLQLKRTDGEFWKILDFTFLEGGPITDQDEATANFVAVINEATKEKFFGVESGIGKYIEAGRQRFRIVGVVANVPAYRRIPFADIWVPISTKRTTDYREQVTGGFNGLILAHSAADLDAIKKEFDANLPKVPLPNSQYTTFTSIAETHFNYIAGTMPGFHHSFSSNHDEKSYTEENSSRFLLLLTGATLLFMLSPAINLVNLNISRIIERSSEIGVRKSFGASSGALVGQFLVENLLLTAIGGAIGFVASELLLRVLSSSGVFEYSDFHFNLRVFGYAMASVLFFGILSGVFPAWRMARMQPVKALNGSRK
jgi:putative ABC transport system permease protein